MDAIFSRIHAFPTPPNHRTRPLQIICVGPSRSGTDSLRQALLELGYTKVFHGYETISDSNRHQKPLLSRFVNKKYASGQRDGNVKFTAEEFDQLFGEYDAITDFPGAVLAAELVDAYPDAKVILNRRKDVDAWFDSVLATMGTQQRSWSWWLLSWFQADLYWSRKVVFRDLFPRFFRGDFVANGKWVYREHCAMARGLPVPKERFLEWGVEDGWGLLCKFLGKEVPQREFPRGNTSADFARVLAEAHGSRRRQALRNLALVATVFIGLSSAVVFQLLKIDS